MKILLTPYDLAACSLGARGALMLGCEVGAAFPPIETLASLSANTSLLVDESLGWLTPFLHEEWISFGDESLRLWDIGVETRARLGEPDWFGATCPRDDHDHEERTRRMMADVLRGGRDGWSRLAFEIGMERTAMREDLVLARVRADSQSAKIEQTLAATVCRFSVVIPIPKDASGILEFHRVEGASGTSLIDAVGRVFIVDREGAGSSEGVLDALRIAAVDFGDRAAQAASDNGWTSESVAVTGVRYPADITLRAAKSAMGAVRDETKCSEAPPPVDHCRGAYALVFKPMKLRA